MLISGVESYPMRAFEIYVNGEKLCTAGIGDDGVLSAIASSVTGRSRADLHLHVGGLISLGKEHVSWIEQRHLAVGDEILVKVVEANSVDEPKRRSAEETTNALEDRKKYVLRLAKELGMRVEGESKEPEL